MNVWQSIKTMIGGSIISRAFVVLAFLFGARFMGPAEFALVSLGVAIVNISIGLADLGIFFGSFRAFTKGGRLEQAAGSILAISLISALLSYAAVGLFSVSLSLLLPAILLSVINSLLGSVRGFLASREEFRFLAATEIAGKLVFLLLAVLRPAGATGFLYYIAADLGLELILCLAKTGIPRRLGFLPFSAGLGISLLVKTLPNSVQPLVMKYIAPAAEIGILGIAMHALNILTLLVSRMEEVLIPASGAHQAWDQTRKWSLKLAAILAFLLILAYPLFGLAELILPEYAGIGKVLWVYLLSIPLILSQLYPRYRLYFAHGDNTIGGFEMTKSVLVVVLTLWLGTTALGAAIARVIGEAAGTVLYFMTQLTARKA